jgi:hypothetical protein
MNGNLRGKILVVSPFTEAYSFGKGGVEPPILHAIAWLLSLSGQGAGRYALDCGHDPVVSERGTGKLLLGGKQGGDVVLVD